MWEEMRTPSHKKVLYNVSRYKQRLDEPCHNLAIRGLGQTHALNGAAVDLIGPEPDDDIRGLRRMAIVGAIESE